MCVSILYIQSRPTICHPQTAANRQFFIRTRFRAMIIPSIHPPPIIQPSPMLTQYKYHTLPYKYPPLLLPHTDHEMFLVICELNDKLSGSLGGDHDSVDHAISDRLNKVIVWINKGSKATCN